MRKLFLIFAVIFLVSCQKKNDTQDLTKYVDPFIGTDFHGHTFPGVVLPFGQIQLSPDNGSNGWDWCSGYHYSDSSLYGFSHTHLSGTGCGDLADVSVLPVSQDIAIENLKLISRANLKSFHYLQKYSHNQEKAEVGYYQVKLLTDNINVELSATQRVGFHKYTFEKGKNQAVIFNVDFFQNWDSVTVSEIKAEGKDMLVGCRHSTGWAKDQKLFFAIKLSKPFKEFVFVGKDYKKTENEGVKGVAIFDPASGEQLIMKVAISSVSIEGAKKNLADDKNEWDFDKVVADAKNAWNQELSKIEVKTKDEDLKKVFYTAVYHSFIHPNIFSDVDGMFKGYNNQPTKANGKNQYTVLSLWDTFRALQPLYALTQKELYVDIINSMLIQYQQTGLLSVWELMGNETNCMIGYHSVPIITDAILKDMQGFDKELALKAMMASSNSDLSGLKFYRQYKYIPCDLENASVAKTLEYSYDDWCIAQAAKKLGKEDIYKTYMERSKYYTNLFDPSVGFMRAKDSKGKWVKEFDPKYSDHTNSPYVEGNGWQWLWFAPHDFDNLVSLLGGKEAAEKKLDAFFSETSELKGKNVSADISGLIGQYAHGNEPSHSTAFIYNFVGKPEKSQKIINQILNTLYTSKKDGLCGNDDCGQMSAWYVLSSVGLYPVNSCDEKYYFANPLFEEVKIKLDAQKTLIVKAPNVSKENIYIKSASLNGKKLDRNYVTYDEIKDGGEIVFEMGK